MTIQGIMATLFVADMDRSVEFYTLTLGLPLAERYGNQWASIDVGKGTAIGLHPTTGGAGPSGGSGRAIELGLSIDVPLEEAVRELASRGVVFDHTAADDNQVRLAFFRDPDGHTLYLAEVQKRS
jgi:catechol 2,3-dioxygenase-like lactoylglutathione lyase family enzyme